MSNLTQQETTEDYYSEQPGEIPTSHQTLIKTPLNDSIDSTHAPFDKFKNFMIPLKKDKGAVMINIEKNIHTVNNSIK